MARKAKSPAPVANPVVEVEAVEVAANPFAGFFEAVFREIGDRRAHV